MTRQKNWLGNLLSWSIGQLSLVYLPNPGSLLPNDGTLVKLRDVLCREQDGSTRIDDFRKIANDNFTLAHFLVIYPAMMSRFF